MFSGNCASKQFPMNTFSRKNNSKLSIHCMFYFFKHIVANSVSLAFCSAYVLYNGLFRTCFFPNRVDESTWKQNNPFDV